MPASYYLEQRLLQATLRGIAYTPPSTLYLSLYTSNPTKADTGAEVTGGGYARQVIVFTNPAQVSGVMTCSNTANVPFPIATALYGVVSHWGIRDALTGGNLLYFEAITEPRTIRVNDRYTAESGKTIIRFP